MLLRLISLWYCRNLVRLLFMIRGGLLTMFSFYGSKSLEEMKVGEADYFEWTSKKGWRQKCLQGDTRSIVHFALPDINPDELKIAIHQMRRSETILQGFFLVTLALTLYAARRFFMEVPQKFLSEAAPLAGLCFATCVAWDQYKQRVMEFAFSSALFCNNAFRIVETNMLRYRSDPPLSPEAVLHAQSSWW